MIGPLRNPAHRKLSIETGTSHDRPRPGEKMSVVQKVQLLHAGGYTEGYRPAGLKAAPLDHHPSGQRFRSRLPLSRKYPTVRPFYQTEPAPFGPYTSWPFTTIGRVFAGTNPDLVTWDWSGSGTLVGPNLLLTASHIVPWAATNGTWWMSFVANYADGSGIASSNVQSVYGVPRYPDGSGTDDGHDVAICSLYSRLGDSVGWMGSQSWQDTDTYKNLSNSMFSIGYPGAYKNAEEPEWAYYPNLHDTDDDGDGAISLETDRFTSSGWSGGPIYGPVDNKWTVLGVCSAEISEYIFPATIEDDSVFAGGSWMVELIKYGLATWP
jgi:V8-like Glu-specific endopeptidase